MGYLRITTLAGALALLPFSLRAQALAVPFFDDSTVQVIHLTMDPQDWATLQQHYLENTYYPATFEWRGVTVTNLGVRSRGSASRSPIKPNLDLDFQRYVPTQTFLGLPWVILKANNQDPSNLREWVAMKTFRRMGLPASREAPAQVYLNGQLLGFYMIVERLNEAFLDRNFGENTGYLYEFQDTGSYEFNDLGTDPAAYAPLLDLKTHQPSPNLQNFMNMVQVINRPSSPEFTDADFIAAISAYMNPRLFLMYAAVESVLAEADGLCGGVVGINNTYIYQFHNQTLYQLIPWDKDITFSTPERDPLFGITTGTNINLLAKRLAGIPEYRNVLLEYLARVMAAVGGPGGWADTEIDRQYAIIREAATNDPNKQCPQLGQVVTCGAGDFEVNVQWLHTFLANRSATVTAALVANGYTPATGGPVISNDGVVVWGGAHAFSPGAVAVISGSGFGPEAYATQYPLPRTLQKSFSSVEGVRAPLFGGTASWRQILVPGDLGPGKASLVISNDGALTPPVAVAVQSATPAIAAVVHADGTAVSAARPAAAGEIVVIYAVGLGPVRVNLPMDAAAPFDPLAWTADTPKVLIGALPMTVAYSGLVPGYLGVYQVNAVVPASLPPNSGTLPFTLTQSDQTTVWQPR